MSKNQNDTPTVERILEIVCPQIKYAKCDHKKNGQYTFWRADSGLCWCNKCGMCLNGIHTSDPNFQDPITFEQRERHRHTGRW